MPHNGPTQYAAIVPNFRTDMSARGKLQGKLFSRVNGESNLSFSFFLDT